MTEKNRRTMDDLQEEHPNIVLYNERRTFIGLVALGCVGCLVCGAILTGSLGRIINLNWPLLFPEATPVIVAPASTPTPASLQRSVDPTAYQFETESQLQQTERPIRDLRALASRLQAGGEPLAELAHQTAPSYTLGDEDIFWIMDDTGPEPAHFQVTATLAYQTEHAHWWVENGQRFDEAALRRSADLFETETYPTTRAIFGSEWTPGVDSDPRLHIFLGRVPGVGGYFASLHEFTQAVNPFSNEREMFFINLNALRPGTSQFDGVLAHEFQHMIHWHQDRNENTWLNEGFSELAAHLNGFDVGNTHRLYLENPDLQLNTWGNSPSESLPHYGSSFLFAHYLHHQFGEDFIRNLVTQPADGLAGLEKQLQAQGLARTANSVFNDFTLATYLNNPNLANGRWGMGQLDFDPPRLVAQHQNFPLTQQTSVRQYGVDYIGLTANRPLTLVFTGSTTARLLNTTPFAGNYLWYSNRGDDSVTSLTRAVDLTAVPTATLRYQVWYDIEEDWDYAYLQISQDGGTSWRVLPASGMRTTNPSGNAYGPGYTGQSHYWQAQEVDLTPFVGQAILLRFEYITDDAISAPGFAVDNIAIPEIGFFDGAEEADSGWVAEGFLRTDNLLRQRFTLHVIDQQTQPPTVTAVPLEADNTLRLTLGTPSQGVDAVLVLSALAPLTTEPALYVYGVE